VIPQLTLGLVALAAALPQPAAAGAATPSCQDVAPRGAAVLCSVNVVRRAHGLRPVARDPRLEQAARGHARDMVARRYFDHVSPSGGTMLGRVGRTGWLVGRGTWWLGEDLAWGSGSLARPDVIVQAWMNSPPHRLVLLSRSARVGGVGVADGTPKSAGAPGATYDLDLGS